MMIEELEKKFKHHSDPDRARAMSAYMRGQFAYYGIPAPLRKDLCSSFLRRNSIQDPDSLKNLVLDMWSRSEREWQYTAIELLERNMKCLGSKDIAFVTELITSKSWWDTVDPLAANVAGKLLQLHPESVRKTRNQWMKSGNLWLQRTCLIHQLKYKSQTDSDYLTEAILQLNHSDEFFIRKAIGWALRQYARINPEWVIRFTEVNSLKPLSKKEALRNLF